MTEYSNRSQSGGEYEWHYEYYDDEEPVSFEGLRANRYSIVIGFWVGLAVFVIFMFFVLTLLTKTGAPHLEIPDPSEKHHGLADCVLEGAAEDERGDEDEYFLSDFHIPNFVSSEQNSSVGNNDFLLCELPIITDSQSAALKSLEPAHTSYDVIRR
ncbi:hypothetical protein cypCar_00016552 [Cyprinus carpio]|nr:hypothetical protein cypCar_00016552 [Cyprinus carpio]